MGPRKERASDKELILPGERSYLQEIPKGQEGLSKERRESDKRSGLFSAEHGGCTPLGSGGRRERAGQNVSPPGISPSCAVPPPANALPLEARGTQV